MLEASHLALAPEVPEATVNQAQHHFDVVTIDQGVAGAASDRTGLGKEYTFNKTVV